MRRLLIDPVVTAETARQMLSGTLAPGVYHGEQVLALDPMVAALPKDVPDLVAAL